MAAAVDVYRATVFTMPVNWFNPFHAGTQSRTPAWYVRSSQPGV